MFKSNSISRLVKKNKLCVAKKSIIKKYYNSNKNEDMYQPQHFLLFIMIAVRKDLTLRLQFRFFNMHRKTGTMIQ